MDGTEIRAFRTCLGRFASGVTVVTGSVVRRSTCSAVSSQPPLVINPDGVNMIGPFTFGQ
jgi:hypothetical protein